MWLDLALASRTTDGRSKFIIIISNTRFYFLQVYDVGPTVTMMMSYVFMMLYLPVNFPSVWVVDKWGLRAGTLMGIGFTTAGYWLRCLINVNFYTCLIG